jgi:hypothetical protein
MNVSEIATVAQNAGFSGQDLITAVAVAMAESSGNPDAFGDASIGQGSFGLWQISSKYHPEFGPDFSALYDPQANANAAFSVYQAAGASFSPWSTFKSGSYEQFLDSVAAAIAVAVTQNPGTSGALLLVIALVAYLIFRKA